jgi:hypothetical protein
MLRHCRAFSFISSLQLLLLVRVFPLRARAATLQSLSRICCSEWNGKGIGLGGGGGVSAAHDYPIVLPRAQHLRYSYYWESGGWGVRGGVAGEREGAGASAAQKTILEAKQPSTPLLFLSPTGTTTATALRRVKRFKPMQPQSQRRRPHAPSNRRRKPTRAHTHKSAHEDAGHASAARASQPLEL